MGESPLVVPEEWLRGVVAKATGRSAPAGGMPPAVHRLAGHASARVYWRVGEPGNGSVVVMLHSPDAPPDEITKASASSPLVGIRPFVDVQRYLSGLSVRVPRILAFDEQEAYVVLEDLGDDMLVTRLRKGEAQEPLYADAVDLLAAMQVATDAAPDPDCVAFQRTYDHDLYLWELEHFVEWVIFAWKGVRLSGKEEAVLHHHFESIASDLVAQPGGFTHRDYQSRNLMVLGDGTQAMIDFQDALVGPRPYDLVSLLRDSYVVLTQPFIAGMIRRYLRTTLELGGPALAEGPFRRVFDLLTVQRKLKDAGRFIFIDRVKGNPDFLGFIPAALAYVREALLRLPELAELQALLAHHVPELGCEYPTNHS